MALWGGCRCRIGMEADRKVLGWRLWEAAALGMDAGREGGWGAAEMGRSPRGRRAAGGVHGAEVASGGLRAPDV